MQTLEIRKTRSYVGTWRHLDEWEDVGEFDVVGEWTTLQMDNAEESTERVKIVCVACDDVELAVRALRDEFSSYGCSHDYDCCGCWSHYAEAFHLKEDRYAVIVNSRRNY